MSCPHGTWHTEDCVQCKFEERVGELEAEVRKYRSLFIATAMKYALAKDFLNPDTAFCELAASAAKKSRQDWIDLFGVEAKLHETICAELDKLAKDKETDND